MGRRHHFQLDVESHSVTVNVYSGRPREVELLVDGEEVARRQVQSAGSYVLTADLPEDRTRPLRIRVHQPRFGSSVPSCSVELDGVQQPMPERAVA